MIVMVTPVDENATREVAFPFGTLVLWHFGASFSDKEGSMQTRGNDSEGGAMREKEQFRAWFDALEDMVHVVDRNMRLVFVNAALRTMEKKLGSDSFLIGERLPVACPFLNIELWDRYERVFRIGETFHGENEERFARRRALLLFGEADPGMWSGWRG